MTKKYKAGRFFWERELYQSEVFLSLKKFHEDVSRTLPDVYQTPKYAATRVLFSG
jgi:hypothetical protein